MKAKKIIIRLFTEILTLVYGVIFAFPVILLFLNTFKPQNEMFDSFTSWPKEFILDNYIEAWNNMRYLHILMNTVLVTLGGVFLVIMLASMAAYRIARIRTKRSNFYVIYFVMSMMLPFQTIMIPVAQIVAKFKLNGSRLGYILVITALLMPFTIYLYRGFCKQIPIELEEAAKIDGAGSLKTFFVIILPLLKPVTITAVILNTMNIWNEYILAQTMLFGRDTATLQVAVMQYSGNYNLKWNLTLATVAVVILPIIILYLLLQKQIEGGMVAGSLKG